MLMAIRFQVPGAGGQSRNSKFENRCRGDEFRISSFVLSPSPQPPVPSTPLVFRFRDAPIQRIDRKIRLLAIDHQGRHQPDGALTAAQDE